MLLLHKLTTPLKGIVWAGELAAMPPHRALLVRFLRVLHMVGREMAQGQLNLRAMSLVYTTLLSLVPLLAVSFSVLKGFGVHRSNIEPLLLRLMVPMGEQGVELTDRILGFVDNVKAGMLGGVGLILLFYTVVALIQKVERAFNYAWHVGESRNLAERFGDYFSVVIIGPVLVFSALGITATVMHSSVVQALVAIEPFGTTVRVGTKLVPYLLVIGAFTFVYVFMPNTKVRVGAALTGAVVAGILWESVGWGFASFVATSSRQTAIYSSFAILFFFMLWLYLAWLILLVGASVAFYTQHPEYLGLTSREIQLSTRLKERLVLHMMLLIGRHFLRGEPNWTLPALAQTLAVPSRPLEALLSDLERSRILVATGENPPAYVPARELDQIRIGEVLNLIRKSGEDEHLNPGRLGVARAVDQLLGEVDEAVGRTLESRTLKDLASTESGAPVAIKDLTREQADVDAA